MPVLDGLRGMAVLLVMVYHFLSYVDRDRLGTSLIHSVFSIGWVGVEIFFVLSGFLITGILLRAKGSSNFFRNFYIRRSLRIFPLYYLVLLIVLAYSVWKYGIGNDWPISGREQFWLWVYCSNISAMFTNSGLVADDLVVTHFWSLSIEEQFYLCWPLAVYHLSGRQLARVAIGLILVAIALRLIMNPALGGRAVYHFTFCRLDGLLIGSLLALARSSSKFQAPLLKFSKLGTWVSLGVLGAIAVSRNGLGHNDRVVQGIGYSCINVLTAFLLWNAVTPGSTSGLNAFIGNPTFRFLGKYSYGIYVFHGLLRPLFQRLIPFWESFSFSYRSAAFLYLVTSVLLSIGIAMTSYHLFESRFLALKHRFE